MRADVAGTSITLRVRATQNESEKTKDGEFLHPVEILVLTKSGGLRLREG
jgi:hypothetical protein